MSDKKQKLSIEHEAAILNHAFVPLNGGIQLKLWLNIKLTDRNNYMCQLQTQGRKICSEATEIKFEGKILGTENRVMWNLLWLVEPIIFLTNSDTTSDNKGEVMTTLGISV